MDMSMWLKLAGPLSAQPAPLLRGMRSFAPKKDLREGLARLSFSSRAISLA